MQIRVYGEQKKECIKKRTNKKKKKYVWKIMSIKIK
jgi:hypothetical protein